MSNPMPTCELSPEQSTNSNPRGKPQVYSDCLAMQRKLKASALKPDCKPADQAQLARAYVELEKLKRITRGLPANTSQSIRSEAKPKKSRSSVGPLEPVQVEPRTIEPEPEPEPVKQPPKTPVDEQPAGTDARAAKQE